MTASRPDRELLRQATDWMMRLSAAPADRALHDAAGAWRARDPAHAVAWRQAERAWRAVAFATPTEADVDRVRADEAGHSQVPSPAPAPRARTSRWMMAAVSLLAVLALSFYAPPLVMNFGADHATRTAEHRSVGLQDGSTVELGAASAIGVEFNGSTRAVRLLKGEAFFSVKPGDARAFTVRAGEVSIVVTGTAFNVRLDYGAVAVLVEHGSVEVTMPGTAAKTQVRRSLKAGDQLVSRTDGSIEQSILPVAEAGSWRRHRLFVDGATVGEVINDLRRYDRGWIVVTDEALLRKRVTGLYDLRDPAEALRVLVGPFGAQVRPVPRILTVVSGS
ncbi:FecR domain-containing protein [Reyranella sp.]|uniref:FecR family protein n=1 Tax=Reyranella sp. TaxID=1929291 RepID=UPI0025E4B27B|nr:FecR domain-containing protein [Reyranella sp.]